MIRLRLLGINLLTIILVSGCLRTQVCTDRLSTDELRLANLNTRQITAKMNFSNKTSVGHQYLLFLPFGRIELQQTPSTLSQLYQRELIRKGITPLWDQNSPNVTLELNVLELSISAYDLIFTRRIVIDLNVAAILRNSDGTIRNIANINTKKIEYVRFAFSRQLQHTLDFAVRESTKKLISELW